jgi:hypothetical protein
MHEIENFTPAPLPSLDEIAAEFGAPLFQFVKQERLEYRGYEASQVGRSLEEVPRTMGVSLSYRFSSMAEDEEPVQLGRVVETLDLLQRTDSSATIEILLARHLDGAVEENSDGEIDLGFRLELTGAEVSSGPLMRFEGIDHVSTAVTQHGYVAAGVVIGDRLLSVALPLALAGTVTYEFEAR